ncbi:hypothetical protein FIC_01607 [Flavobacteriaceae bacterium 3519-10]|nr:hypothetical protein FIC_01607 [Flavobacteriaceae bacterium 3519-10]
MEKTIIFSQAFHQSIEELIYVLYAKKYFGFKTDSHAYAQKIYDFISINVTMPNSRKSPFNFQQYGKKYIKYKANSHTTWYIFFDQKGDRFVINYILNNHSQEYPELF